MVSERSLGVQDVHMDARTNFSFWCLLQIIFNPSRFHLSSISGVGWTGKVPDRSLHFNVSNNSTL